MTVDVPLFLFGALAALSFFTFLGDVGDIMAGTIFTATATRAERQTLFETRSGPKKRAKDEDEESDPVM